MKRITASEGAVVFHLRESPNQLLQSPADAGFIAMRQPRFHPAPALALQLDIPRLARILFPLQIEGHRTTALGPVRRGATWRGEALLVRRGSDPLEIILLFRARHRHTEYRNQPTHASSTSREGHFLQTMLLISVMPAARNLPFPRILAHAFVAPVTPLSMRVNRGRITDALRRRRVFRD